MKRIFAIFLVGFLLLPFLAGAQGLVPCGGEGQPDCTLCHLFQLINNILNWVLFILIPILAPIFIVIGGIMLLVAGGTPMQIFEQTGTKGDPRLYNQAKGVITAVVVGLIIVYTAWVVLSTVITFLGVAEWTGLGTWWQIECPV